jgi:hypothetical protein
MTTFRHPSFFESNIRKQIFSRTIEFYYFEFNEITLDMVDVPSKKGWSSRNMGDPAFRVSLSLKIRVYAGLDSSLQHRVCARYRSDASRPAWMRILSEALQGGGAQEKTRPPLILKWQLSRYSMPSDRSRSEVSWQVRNEGNGSRCFNFQCRLQERRDYPQTMNPLLTF